MELIVTVAVLMGGVFALFMLTPFGDLVVFLLDRIGLHLGKKYGLKTTVGSAESKTIVSVGTTGRTLTALLPSGIAECDGKRVDVLAIEKSVGKGEPIRVARVEGTRIYVEKETKAPSTDVAS